MYIKDRKIYYSPNNKFIVDSPNVNFNIDQNIYGSPYFIWDSSEDLRLRSSNNIYTYIINTFTNKNLYVLMKVLKFFV